MNKLNIGFFKLFIFKQNLYFTSVITELIFVYDQIKSGFNFILTTTSRGRIFHKWHNGYKVVVPVIGIRIALKGQSKEVLSIADPCTRYWYFILLKFKSEKFSYYKFLSSVQGNWPSGNITQEKKNLSVLDKKIQALSSLCFTGWDQLFRCRL